MNTRCVYALDEADLFRNGIRGAAWRVVIALRNTESRFPSGMTERKAKTDKKGRRRLARPTRSHPRERKSVGERVEAPEFMRGKERFYPRFSRERGEVEV